jgi:hypothetical protein
MPQLAQSKISFLGPKAGNEQDLPADRGIDRAQIVIFARQLRLAGVKMMN